MELAGKSAIVTGGGSGIGREIALRLANEGAAVLVADRFPEACEGTRSLISQQGGKAASFVGDVGVAADMEQMAIAAEEAFGRIDILVCSAGISPAGSVTDTTPQLWDDTIRIVLTGVFLSCKWTIPMMLARGGGSIVTIGGTLGLYAMRNKAAYCAAKAGVVNLTRQMALDYGRQNLRVNCICPGFVDTPLNAGVNEASRERVFQRLPLPFAAEPKDIADAVLFLVSDKARYITGAILSVDGGQSAGLA